MGRHYPRFRARRSRDFRLIGGGAWNAGVSSANGDPVAGAFQKNYTDLTDYTDTATEETPDFLLQSLIL